MTTCPTHDQPLTYVALTGVRECPEPGCAEWAEEEASARVPGHTLRDEGAAFVVNERQQVVPAGEWWYSGTSGLGRGRCSCGALSDILDSGNQRKAWHRRHKAAVLAEQDGA